ncbi:hypothetical protein [Kineococcus aurantiacus]|uniref:Uncharacterized protein n=1 Tax=Kineococcus aurantiacus TaxID=37633 RepID=A0A7Y9ARJ9_9ACTN|nr:hypothetical protein [Kineococcus aurantiacus]NYD20467.1 hypothetical protein [Kineococcus aurantiacus]
MQWLRRLSEDHRCVCVATVDVTDALLIGTETPDEAGSVNSGVDRGFGGPADALQARWRLTLVGVFLR